jgi:hypothetical protein
LRLLATARVKAARGGARDGVETNLELSGIIMEINDLREFDPPSPSLRRGKPVF